MSGSLTTIKPESWPALRDKFLVDWPRNAMGYYTIENFIKWNRLDSAYEDCVFYSLDDDWSDGTVLILVRL